MTTSSSSSGSGRGHRDAPVTIVDVAHAAGVSHSTVSRVLNGHPHIKASTAQRVLDAVEELGYVANLQARGLAGGRVGIIGLVVYDMASSYITEIVRAVDRALADVGLELMLCTTHQRERAETNYVRRLSRGVVDGLIVLLPDHPEEYVADLTLRQFPLVLLEDDGMPHSHTVVSDGTVGTRLAIEHLAALGHHRIGLISGDLHGVSGRERLAAYRQAVADLGLDDSSEIVMTGDYLEETAESLTHRLLDLPNPPTAIYASADTAAKGCLSAAQARGIRVPEDLSVVGFDDIPEAMTFSPPLTTVRQPFVEIGRTAVQLLVEKIDEPATDPRHIRLPVDLIVRDTTAPPSR